MYRKFIQIWNFIRFKRVKLTRRFLRKNNFLLEISKRQKFIISVIFLSSVLFLSEYLFGKSGVYIAFLISFLTDIFLFWAVNEDLKDNFSLQIFILPFLFSLAFGLFYFLIPARFLTRTMTTSLYAIGLYSLLLSQNIFLVSSIRTIALLSSARTVSFVTTLLAYFFLSNVLFTLHLNIFVTLTVLFILSFPLILQSIWTYTLDNKLFSQSLWVLCITICLIEIALVLWFWPVIPTIIALFLTGFFYIVVGLSHVWLERRLFRNVMWEYIWVAVVVFIIFIFFAFRS